MSLHAEVSSTVWYHTIDLGDGLVTPGWFDLRPYDGGEDSVWIARRPTD